MAQRGPTPGLPKSLVAYITLTGAAGAACLAYLVPRMDWGASEAGEAALFTLLIVVAGSFPLPVAPKVKADMSTAVLFGSALLLDAGTAALAAGIGVPIYTFFLRYRGDKLRLPWYKYPFNAGAAAIFVGLASVVFHQLAADNEVLTPAVLAAAAVMYLANTALITGAASLQMGMNPVRFWWMGTRENGPAEVALMAVGLVGAMAYSENPWTIVALIVPTAIIYVAFSGLARANKRLEEAAERLKALQGQIATNAKLASVGAISLDIAHQIKNPLTILLGHLESLESCLASDDPCQSHVAIATTAGDRIKELTENFTSMGYQKPLQMDPRKLLSEAYGMAGLLSRRAIEANWEYQEDLPKIPGNPVLLREALSNIFSNAMDAVGEDGRITTITTRVNGEVVTRITDNGCGIPQDIKDQLFEPFQSTKPHGSGLVLFATKHILEMHRGSLKVESEVGLGTTVTITLPIHQSPAEN